MRRLYVGGSFNPIHYGHILCARFSAEAAGFDRVVFVPAALNPHKDPSADLADSSHRLAMIERAIRGDPFFEVDAIELSRPPPSYSIVTAEELLRRDPSAGRIAWLIGADILPRLHHWHRFDELPQKLELVAMNRAGRELDLSLCDPRVAEVCHRFVEIPEIEISSTMIRKRLAAGLSIEHLTPPAVVKYIREHHLYQ